MAGSKPTRQLLKQPDHFSEEEQAIEKTIKFLQNEGRTQQTIETAARRLRHLNKNTDIFDVNKVKEYIMNGKTANGRDWCKGYKQDFLVIYKDFCSQNQMLFEMPKRLNYEPPIPLIPSTDDVNRILAMVYGKFLTPLTIMSETAVEGQELHLTRQSQINKEQGTISVTGTKQHDNGTYKLKEQTAEMLRQYLAKRTAEQPFPTSRELSHAWLSARRRAAEKFCKPELNKYPMKNLRNYAGAVFYLTMGKDPIATKEFMRHKRLDQTMKYLRGIKEFTATAAYVSVMTDDPEKAMELLNQGFKEESVFKINGAEKHIFRKLKT